MIEQAGDAVTITGKQALAAAYRATLLGIRQRRHDGLPWGDLLELAHALRVAHGMSPECRELATAVKTSAGWNDQSARDWCDVAEAAQLLGLSKRQIQRMARDTGGLEAIRVGRIWKLRRAPLLVLAEERARDRTGRLPVELASARRTPA